MEHIIDYTIKFLKIESKYNEQKANIKAEIRYFIKLSLKDNLFPNLKKYNVSKFDTD
jgi:hypothetical protein